jgi:hypothetical protein
MKSLSRDDDWKSLTMQISIAKVAGFPRSGTADSRTLITATFLVFFLTIGFAGCGGSGFERADDKRSFYGSIVDQDGHPVHDTTITMRREIVRMDGRTVNKETICFNAKSDREGIFVLPGLEYPHRDISPEIYEGVIPRIYASAPGFIIDNFAIRKEFVDDASARGDRAKPHLIRAWKFADRRLNREIRAGDEPTAAFVLGDARELYVKINLNLGRVDGLGNPDDSPNLASATEHEDWDVAISLASDASDAGDSPFTKDWMRRTPPGTAIRVRARVGSVCQADPIFPFSAKGKAFSPVIALNWSGLHRIDDHGWFRFFYRSDLLGYTSFLTVSYRHGSVNQEKHCSLSFAPVGHLDVPYVGVLNPSGDDCLEYDPVYSYIMRRLGVASENHSVHEEDYLPHLRQRDPRLAREIEARLRAQGKEVPP